VVPVEMLNDFLLVFIKGTGNVTILLTCHNNYICAWCHLRSWLKIAHLFRGHIVFVALTESDLSKFFGGILCEKTSG